VSIEFLYFHRPLGQRVFKAIAHDQWRGEGTQLPIGRESFNYFFERWLPVTPSSRHNLMRPQGLARPAVLETRDYPDPTKDSFDIPDSFLVSVKINVELLERTFARSYEARRLWLSPQRRAALHEEHAARNTQQPGSSGSCVQMALPGYSCRPMRVMTKPGSVSMA
jgi:hypothetical protein